MSKKLKNYEKLRKLAGRKNMDKYLEMNDNAKQ